MKPIKFIVLIISFSIISLCNGQGKFKLGIAGGINYSKLTSGDYGYNNKELKGFNSGIIMELKLPHKIGLEANILYSTKGRTFNYDQFSVNPLDQTLYTREIEERYSYIDIPVLLKIYFARVVSFQIGPQYSIVVSANNKFEGVEYNGYYDSSDFIAVIGFGLDISRVHFSCRYNYELTPISDNSYVSKKNMLTLSVGLWLKK